MPRYQLPVFDPQKLGVRFTPDSELFTVNAAQIDVLPSNQRRVSVLFQNLGATTITISPFGSVVSVQAIRLLTNDPPLSFFWGDWGCIVGQPWVAIGNAPGGSLFVMQQVWDTDR